MKKMNVKINIRCRLVLAFVSVEKYLHVYRGSFEEELERAIMITFKERVFK